MRGLFRNQNGHDPIIQIIGWTEEKCIQNPCQPRSWMRTRIQPPRSLQHYNSPFCCSSCFSHCPIIKFSFMRWACPCDSDQQCFHHIFLRPSILIYGNYGEEDQLLLHLVSCFGICDRVTRFLSCFFPVMETTLIIKPSLSWWFSPGVRSLLLFGCWIENDCIFHFALPSPGLMPWGQKISLRASSGDAFVMRGGTGGCSSCCARIIYRRSSVLGKWDYDVCKLQSHRSWVHRDSACGDLHNALPQSLSKASRGFANGESQPILERFMVTCLAVRNQHNPGSDCHHLGEHVVFYIS